jgi:hypothetical protein
MIASKILSLYAPAAMSAYIGLLDRVTPVWWFESTTLEHGTTAPLGFVTQTEIYAIDTTCCARSESQGASINKSRNMFEPLD